MKCIGLMGLSITKSISSSQFSHVPFILKKALNKPHGNYPKLESADRLSEKSDLHM